MSFLTKPMVFVIGFIVSDLFVVSTIADQRSYSFDLHQAQINRDVCIIPVIGLEKITDSNPKLFPKLGAPIGKDCNSANIRFELSVTQENIKNTHQGSKNYNSNIVSYMADFNFNKDFGRWVMAKVDDDHVGSILLGLNTIDFDEQNSVTGWPLRQGHLFVALNDTDVSITLEQDINVTFDIQIVKASLLKNVSFSGQRVMLGALAKWDETPDRKNSSHFLELDMIISDGFSDYYREATRAKCSDIAYDRCFYDELGRFAEGRQISLQTISLGSNLVEDANKWTHIRIPIAAIYRKLSWASPPKTWGMATIKGVYLGIEAIGAAETIIRFKNLVVREELGKH